MTFFTKTKLAVLLLLLPCLSFAQDGPFWTEEFSEHNEIFSSGNWTTNDASSNEIETLWQQCTMPESCPPNTITDNLIRDNFQSTTVSNGYVFSFSQENDSLSENHLSQLTSPPIPVIATDELYLEFQSFLITINTREHVGAHLYVQADGGDWEEHEIYPDVPNYPAPQLQKTHNSNTFFIDLSQYANAANISLRWEWLGNKEVIWCLDDCKLFNYNPLDTRKIWDSGGFTGGMNGWSIMNTTPNMCSWEWEPIGYYGDAFLPAGNDNKFINSPTFRTGAVVVNGDNCFTDNEAPTMDPMSFPPFRSELISPLIDLSSTTDQVLLDFYQVIRKVDNEGVGTIPSPFLFSYSLDNGTTWSVDEPLNESYPSNLTFHTHESLLLPVDLIGEANVKLKFIFDGKLFYWGLDDIRILERAANDMRISKEFFAIPPSYSTPVSQLDSVVFLADIENFGTETQSDIWLHIEIENTDEENIVYHDSLFIPFAAPLQLVENQLFNTAFLPPSFPAHYKGTYRVESSADDDVPSNDAISFNFEVTEELFAKESMTSFGFAPLARDYSWGNSFYIPNGDGYYADSVFFTIANLSQMIGKSIQVDLYEWETNTENTLLATLNEYEPIAINIFEITEEIPNLKGIPVDISGERIPLKDNTQYFVVLRYDRILATDKPCFIATSQSSDYAAMNLASNLRNDLRYATLWKSAATETFSVIGIGNGSGFDYIPQIRLSIADSPTSITKVAIKQNELKLFPNPAQSDFSIDLPNDTKGNVLIYNNLGVLTRTINEFSVGKNIPIQNLAKGTYSVHFIDKETEEIMVGKLVKM